MLITQTVRSVIWNQHTKKQIPAGHYEYDSGSSHHLNAQHSVFVWFADDADDFGLTLAGQCQAMQIRK